MEQPQPTLKAFLALTAAQFVAVAGWGLSVSVINVWIYGTTGSPLLVGLVTLCSTLSGALFAPVAGWLCDRFNRRTMMLAGLMGGSASALGAVVLAMIPNVTGIRAWLILPVIMVGSAAVMLHHVATDASIVLLAVKSQLGRANGLLGFVNGLAFLGAPALGGGFLVLSGNFVAVFALQAGSFVVAAGVLLLIRIPDVPPGAEAGSTWQVIKSRNLVPLLMMITFLAFCIPVAMMAVPFVLGSGMTAVSWVLVAGSLGALAGSLLMAVWGGIKRWMSTLLAGLIGAGLLLILAGLDLSLVAVAIGAAGFGFMGSVVFAANAAIWQAVLPVGRQGRAFGLQRLFTELGYLLVFLMAGPMIGYAHNDVSKLLEPFFGVGTHRGAGLLLVLLGLVLLIFAGRVRSLASEKR